MTSPWLSFRESQEPCWSSATSVEQLCFPIMAGRGDRIQNARRSGRGQYAAPSPVLFVHEQKGCACDESVYQVDLETSGHGIVQRVHYERGKLVFFAIVHTVDGTEVYSVDSGHGHLHDHPTGHRRADDRRDIRALYSAEDVDKAFDEGYELAHNHYKKTTGGA